MPGSDLPPFIDYSGEQVFQQSFSGTACQTHNFVFEADLDTIQRVFCDQRLNRSGGDGSVDFRAASAYLQLTFAYTTAIRSTVPPFSDMGSFPETASWIWLIVGDLRQKMLGWFLPYIFVDNSYSMSMGREIYGFPKSIGWFQIPDDPATGAPFTAETLVFPTFSPDTAVTRAAVWEVRRVGPPAADAAPTTWTDISTMVKELSHAVLGSEHVSVHDIVRNVEASFHVAEELAERDIPLINVKQFRAVPDGARAASQCVTQVPLKITRFAGAALMPGEYAITFHNHASHPVLQDLGLYNGNATRVITPKLAYSMAFDFESGLGSVLDPTA